MYGGDWIFVSEISMTFMNATYRRIKTFRWKEKVWLIIEDGGIYEMVADEKRVSQVDYMQIFKSTRSRDYT